MNKKGYEMSFSWIFALIAGAFILFLAIYAVIKIAGVARTQTDTTRAQEIGILLTPSETNLEQAKLSTIETPSNQQTRLFNECDFPSETNPFGSQKLSTFVSSGIGEKWQSSQGGASSFHNKYFFGRNNITAEKKFFVLSKPFLLPFKVADIIIMWPDTQEYCFVNSIPELKEELSGLGGDNNLFFADSVERCSQNSVKVCFFSSENACSLIVWSDNSVEYSEFGNEKVRYVYSSDNSNKYAMLLAAIFSEPENYRCESARLGARASNLASLYKLKSNYLTSGGKCRSAPLLPNSLQEYIDKADLISRGNADIPELKSEGEDLKLKNEQLDCKLF